METKSEVFCCDCVEYMRSLPDKFFHLAVADPPYGNANIPGGYKDGRFGGGNTARFYKYRKQTKDDSLAVCWDRPPADDFFTELFRVSQLQIIWGGNFFALPPCKCFLAWVKTNIPDGFSMAQAEYAWTSLPCNAKVFHYSSTRSKGGDHFHPTEKPVALYQWLMQVWLDTLPQPLEHPLRVFDPMMGSQSSRIAAYLMDVDYCGCELDEEYFQRGCQRYERETAGVIRVAKDRPAVRQLSLFF